MEKNRRMRSRRREGGEGYERVGKRGGLGKEEEKEDMDMEEEEEEKEEGRKENNINSSE